MPGISLISGQPVQQSKLERAIEDLKKDGVSQADVLYRDDHLTLVFSGRKDYPHIFRETEDYIFCMEGMIYNIPAADVARRLQLIVQRFSRHESVKEDVTAFVEEADGDFLCVGYSKSTSALLIFNDRWGRLPAFYSGDHSQYLLSREIKFILYFLPSIVIDRMLLTQFVMYQFNIGERTLFRSVSRLMPSRMSLVLPSAKGLSGGGHVLHETLLPLNFDSTGQPPSRDECLAKYTELFLESIRNRASACLSQGYELIADVSGGLDTRGVLAALEVLGFDAEYYCHTLVTGDESSMAVKLAGLYNKQIHIISADHTFDDNWFSDIVYIADGHVNGWTGGTAWNDSDAKRKLIGEKRKVVNFMGFAGEMIRQPFRPLPGSRSLNSMIGASFPANSIRYQRAAEVCGVPAEKYRSILLSHLNEFPESTLEGKVRHYYFNYRQSVNAGEDRTRRLFWTVPPFWSKPLFDYATHHIPLSYTGHALYGDFLRSIDERILSVPVHNKNIRPTSKWSMLRFDGQNRIKKAARTLIFHTAYFRNMYERSMIKKRNASLITNIGDKALSLHASLHSTGIVTSYDRLMNFFDNEYDLGKAYRILSLISYLKTLEELHGDKVGID